MNLRKSDSKFAKRRDVPMGPVSQYVTEPSDEPVALRIYPGADGRFSWYQDDGVSFGYQHGHFLRFRLLLEKLGTKVNAHSIRRKPRTGCDEDRCAFHGHGRGEDDSFDESCDCG